MGILMGPAPTELAIKDVLGVENNLESCTLVATSVLFNALEVDIGPFSIDKLGVTMLVSGCLGGLAGLRGIIVGWLVNAFVFLVSWNG